MRFRRLETTLLLAIFCLASIAYAQTYGGVNPDNANPPPRAGRLSAETDVVLSWPGFVPNASGGGGRFFVQSNHPIVPTVQFMGDRIELTFARARTHLANSVRWLETGHFNTPVVRARLERRRHDVVLVLLLRSATQPNVTQGATGTYAYTYVDFQPGSYLPVEAPTSAPITGAVANERPPSVDVR